MRASLRVAQLNIGSLLEPDWTQRRHEVVAWLQHLDPDIVCLEEVWQDDHHVNSAQWIADQHPGRWSVCFGGFPAPAAFGGDPSLRCGAAVLSRWSIETHELFALPGRDTTSGNPWDAVELELLAARTAGIDVFATHLSPMPQRGSVRRRQVRFIDETVAAWRDPASALPPVLCGDFNAEPDSDEIRFLCGLTDVDGRDTWWQEAWRSAARTDPGFTQHPANPYCARLNLPPKRIDYVFVGDPWLTRRADGSHDGDRGRIVHAVVAFDEPLTGVYASDHFGLAVDIGWPDRPG